MKYSGIRNNVHSAVADILLLEQSELTVKGSTLLTELGLDSIGIVAVLIALEDALDIDLVRLANNVSPPKTFDDLCGTIEALIPG